MTKAWRQQNSALLPHTLCKVPVLLMTHELGHTCIYLQAASRLRSKTLTTLCFHPNASFPGIQLP